jgi:hypothetical protein
MPGFDGTGPRGEGPMTGRGEGHCALVLPSGKDEAPYGYAGAQGTPVCLRGPRIPPVGRGEFIGEAGRAVRWGRGWRRRRGRRSAR